MKKQLTSAILILLSLAAFSAKPKFHKKLMAYCESAKTEFNQISEERKAQLDEIAQYIAEKSKKNEKIVLTIICTHNSRRSHIGQIWSKTAAYYYGIDNFESFSGGTAATAFNPRAVDALNRAGFKIVKSSMGDDKNPKYLASLGNNFNNMMMYSKVYNDSQNPQSNFAAIMVCSEADKSCPVVPGAEARFALPYDDPKFYDNTPQETEKYDERVRQIGREMLYLMSKAKESIILSAESSKK